MNDLPVSQDNINCCSNHKSRLRSWLFVWREPKKSCKKKTRANDKKKTSFFLAPFSSPLRHSFARSTNKTARNAGFHKSTVNSYCYSHLALNLTNNLQYMSTAHLFHVTYYYAIKVFCSWMLFNTFLISRFIFNERFLLSRSVDLSMKLYVWSRPFSILTNTVRYARLAGSLVKRQSFQTQKKRRSTSPNKRKKAKRKRNNTYYRKNISLR